MSTKEEKQNHEAVMVRSARIMTSNA